jgi:redox-sensitive bicupin YhaK (pirin superfamily)
MGNSGLIGSGDIQWMTAGSGIIHQEMPRKYEGLMQGFQLWVNLPAKKKMIDPRYRGITKNQIPTLEREGVKIKLVAGEIDGVVGPVKDLVVDVKYFDVTLASGKAFEYTPEKDCSAFAYAIEGIGYTDDAMIELQHCALFSKCESVKIKTKDNVRFLFVSGKPLNEPVSWGGPIVMNTQEELEKAFQELDEGSFIKTSKISKTVKPLKELYRS